MAQVLDTEYTRKIMPHMFGLTLIPKYWSQEDEDLIWVECIEKPEQTGWINYLFLDNWRIE
jgi:hypothetical protein